MITDEGASFLGDLKRYETKHESYISLLNQLFDGKGDKMTSKKCRKTSAKKFNITQYWCPTKIILWCHSWIDWDFVAR